MNPLRLCAPLNVCRDYKKYFIWLDHQINSLKIYVFSKDIILLLGRQSRKCLRFWRQGWESKGERMRFLLWALGFRKLWWNSGADGSKAKDTPTNLNYS